MGVSCCHVKMIWVGPWKPAFEEWNQLEFGNFVVLLQVSGTNIPIVSETACDSRLGSGRRQWLVQNSA